MLTEEIMALVPSDKLWVEVEPLDMRGGAMVRVREGNRVVSSERMTPERLEWFKEVALTSEDIFVFSHVIYVDTLTEWVKKNTDQFYIHQDVLA